MTEVVDRAPTPWRVLFWEPVASTGERIAVGVVHCFGGQWASARIIRDDVLDVLYGRSASSAKRLIDHGLSLYQVAAAAGGIEHLGISMAGLHASELRKTDAASVGDVLRTAALLYSSLAQIDRFDNDESEDVPPPEEVSGRFTTEVRDVVAARRPDLIQWFSQKRSLTADGRLVRFGYFSPTAVVHFSVLHPSRTSASVRDARARLWELQRAQAASGVPNASLILAVPTLEEPTLGPRQREQLRKNQYDLGLEADDAAIRLHSVTTASQAADRLIETAH